MLWAVSSWALRRNTESRRRSGSPPSTSARTPSSSPCAITSSCLDALEQARLKKLIKRATRPQDISDEEEDEEPIFDPMVVARSSAEGRMMSKWLGAARTRLGGAFPRPRAAEGGRGG